MYGRTFVDRCFFAVAVAAGVSYQLSGNSDSIKREKIQKI